MSAIKRAAALLVALLGMILAVTAFASSSGAAPYTPAPSLAVSSANGCSPFAVAGAGYAANELVDLTLDTGGAALKTVRADADGSFSTTVSIAAGTTGAHTIVATGRTGDTASARITIATNCSGIGGQTGGGGTGNGSGSGSGTGGVAVTGVQVAAISGAGVVLLAAGAMLLISGRRRRAVA
jgi:hypothetical protein